MNKVRLGVTALLLATAMLFVVVANAGDTPAPVDSAAAVSDAGAPDGDAESDAEAGPAARPIFDSLPFSDEKSPRPKTEDWKNAPEFDLTEHTLTSSGFCKIQRLREWMRISCTITTGKITLMCGSSEDVSFGLGPVPVDWGTFPEGGEIVFPIRKGDRRLFEWQSVEFGYKGANSVVNFMVISETWLPGEEKPVIYAH